MQPWIESGSGGPDHRMIMRMLWLEQRHVGYIHRHLYVLPHCLSVSTTAVTGPSGSRMDRMDRIDRKEEYMCAHIWITKERHTCTSIRCAQRIAYGPYGSYGSQRKGIDTMHIYIAKRRHTCTSGSQRGADVDCFLQMCSDDQGLL